MRVIWRIPLAQLMMLGAVMPSGSASRAYPPTAALAAGGKAFRHWAAATPMDNNDWTGSTFMIGLMEYYKSTLVAGSADTSALAHAKAWAEHYDYKLKGSDHPHSPALSSLPPGKHIADHQLCGATYIELYKLDANETYLDDVRVVLQEEIEHAVATSNYWSWVDALFMAMSTYSRLGNVTTDTSFRSSVIAKQWLNFNASALAPADAENRGIAEGNGRTFGFWNGSDHLFYRDDSFIYSQVYWGRGNGWAIMALVAAMEHDGTDPHHLDYLSIYRQLAEELLQLQGSDGAWRASLLNASGYPVPETTGTASFVYALAWGMNNGILPAAQYQAPVTKAWDWLTSVALHEDGRIGNCQPGGGSPQNNFGTNSTSNFCVGQFLLASSQMARLSPSS